MDAVILAAGRGERVGEIAPEFHKPLLPVDGVPLVCRAVDLAHGSGIKIPVVVVSPTNAEAISTAIGDRRVALIIQRKPRGPGHALLTGLSVRPRLESSDRVLVLLSDNVTTYADVEAVKAYDTAIGTKQIDRHDAYRFTRFENNRWIEKEPVDANGSETISCWVGPFIGWRPTMEKKLKLELSRMNVTHPNGELLIGPYLEHFMKLGSHTLVSVSSFDVGTIEAYRRYTSE